MRGGESLLPMPRRFHSTTSYHTFEFGILISFESRNQYAKKKNQDNKIFDVCFQQLYLKFPSEGP